MRQGAAATITGEAFRETLTGQVAEVFREAGVSALYPADPLAASDKCVMTVRIKLNNGQPVRALVYGQVTVRINP